MADEIVRLVAGLPAGPATEASVKRQLTLDDDADDSTIVATVNAVNARVLAFPFVASFIDTVIPVNVDDPDAEPIATWPADIELGATLLAVRLFARRNSPEGVAQFGTEGPVYVQRNDPDVAMLLRLGSYREPRVG